MIGSWSCNCPPYDLNATETPNGVGVGKIWGGTRNLESKLVWVEWYNSSSHSEELTLEHIMQLSKNTYMHLPRPIQLHRRCQEAVLTDKKWKVKMTHKLCKFTFSVIHSVTAKDRVSLMEISLKFTSLQLGRCSSVGALGQCDPMQHGVTQPRWLKTSY